MGRKHTLPRRDFLRAAALAIPAFHPAVWQSAAANTPRFEVRTPLAIRELRLATAGGPGTTAFWQKALGLEPVDDRDGVTLRAGSSRVTFRPVDDGSRPVYHVAFNIPENKLAAAIEWASDRFEILVDPRSGKKTVHFANWNAHSVFFLDPGGNLLEFIARHELGNASKGEFSPADILNVSEIGVVLDDVPAAAKLLTERLGVAPYGSKPNAAFSAMGDANGLFICVARGRTSLFDWEGFREPCPTEIVLDADAPGVLEIPGYPYRVRLNSAG